MAVADKYKLYVSPLTGEAYISTIGKDGHMTNNRRKLEQQEVLHFITSWLISNLEEKQDERTITYNKKTVVSMKLFRENLECKGE